jgi:IS1 family transposase
MILRALLALQLLVEGNGVRSIERITGIHRDTITGLLVKAGERAKILMDGLIRDIPVRDVQRDEIWSFVGKKESRRALGDENYHKIGDAWTFIGIERHTKLVLAYELGKRNTQSACKFMHKIALATSAEHRFQISTDGFPPYEYAVGTQLEDRVDYGKLIKTFRNPTPEEQRRYSPARITSVTAKEILEGIG